MEQLASVELSIKCSRGKDTNILNKKIKIRLIIILKSHKVIRNKVELHETQHDRLNYGEASSRFGD